MGLMNRVKKKAQGHKSIKEGLGQMKELVEAFDEDITKVPEPQDHCVHCTECRSRADKTSRAFRTYFQMLMKGK